MVKLTLRPGVFIDIGENVRVIFSGGSANNIHLLVDAPREINIARSSAGEKRNCRNRVLGHITGEKVYPKRHSVRLSVF